MESKYFRLPAVLQRYGLSRSTIYLLVARSEFPRPIHVGRSSLWSMDELTRFDQAKLAGRAPSAEGRPDWWECQPAESPTAAKGVGA